MEVEELIKKWIPFVKVIEPLSLKAKTKQDTLKSRGGCIRETRFFRKSRRDERNTDIRTRPRS